MHWLHVQHLGIVVSMATDQEMSTSHIFCYKTWDHKLFILLTLLTAICKTVYCNFVAENSGQSCIAKCTVSSKTRQQTSCCLKWTGRSDWPDPRPVHPHRTEDTRSTGQASGQKLKKLLLQTPLWWSTKCNHIMLSVTCWRPTSQSATKPVNKQIKIHVYNNKSVSQSLNQWVSQ